MIEPHARRSTTGDSCYELLDPRHHTGAQAEIILGSIHPVWQPGEKVIHLNRANANAPGNPNVESAARDHREISCRAGGTSGDREVGIESTDTAEEVCTNFYCTWMLKEMVSLSPGPLSAIEA